MFRYLLISIKLVHVCYATNAYASNSRRQLRYGRQCSICVSGIHILAVLSFYY